MRSSGTTEVEKPTRNDTTIAAISAAALIRHQNQRTMNNSPVPAPTCNTSWNVLTASRIRSARPQPSTRIAAVATRPTSTWRAGLAPGSTNRR